MNSRKSFVLVYFVILFSILAFCYTGYSRKIEISYWDEMQWVGQSYLFQFYTEGNFKEKIWDTFNSLDQPSLAKFSYGAWIYPLYLRNKDTNDIDYTKFLISQGFYFIDANLPEYSSYHNSLSQTIPQVKPDDVGFTDYYIKKYGEKINRTLDIIYYSRNLNIIYLSLAVLIFGFFLPNKRGLIFFTIFIFLYGLNALIVRNGLKAHSDALFILIFNTCLVLLYMYLHKQKSIFLILFSIFTGLAMSTKLNGILLYLLFLFLFFIYGTGFSKSMKKTIWQIFYPLLIIISVFAILNPFVHPNLPLKIFEMYQFRANHTVHLAQYFSHQSLPNPLISLTQIFLNFFSYGTNSTYNLPFFMTEKISVGLLMLPLFTAGIYAEYIAAKKKSAKSYFLILSFILILLTTSLYLRLNWDRYLIHVVPFFIYYQVCGMNFIYIKIKKYLNIGNEL